MGERGSFAFMVKHGNMHKRLSVGVPATVAKLTDAMSVTRTLSITEMVMSNFMALGKRFLFPPVWFTSWVLLYTGFCKQRDNHRFVMWNKDGTKLVSPPFFPTWIAFRWRGDVLSCLSLSLFQTQVEAEGVYQGRTISRMVSSGPTCLVLLNPSFFLLSNNW